MNFQNLKLAGWRQFKQVDLEFHPKLTIITGSNGAGKTTLLNILSKHFGWESALVSTPLAYNRSHIGPKHSADYWDKDLVALDALYLEFTAFGPAEATATRLDRTLSEHFLKLRNRFEDEFKSLTVEKREELLAILEKWVSVGMYDPVHRKIENGKPNRSIGAITYSNGSTTQINVPGEVATAYNTQIEMQQQVFGLHIPSHRPIYAYQTVTTIPTEPRGREHMFNQYLEIVRNRYFGGGHQRTPNYYIKESLISLATFGYGNAVVEAIPDFRKIYDGFEEVLRNVLPVTLGFKNISIRIPEIVLVTQTGEFSLDAVSGGIASIIDIAWQLYMYSPLEGEFVVTFDEPENHLHPQLQQSFLPSLLAAFPSVQFIVSSHNPFMVSSVPDANVYVLRHDETRKVVSSKLDTVNRAGTANEILRDVLGLQFTLPLWVNTEIKSIVAEFEMKPLTTDTLNELRDKMTRLGLEKYVAETIAKVAETQGDE